MKSSHLVGKTAAYIKKMLTYCLLLVLVIENAFASPDDCMNSELVSIRHEMRLLRDENQNQTLEIASLKQKVASQDETIRQKIIEELDNLLKTAEHIHSTDTLGRSKRPVRLLPMRVLMGHKNYTDQPEIRKFYGPPTNCSDLSLLGYTLNGYYLVKSIVKPSNGFIETVYCAFKQPEESVRSSTVGNRLPSEIISYNNTTAMRTSFTRWGHLVNDLGKCLTVHADDSQNDRLLLQADCIPTEIGQTWSWNEVTLGSGDNHLCNGYGKCASVRRFDLPSPDLVQWNRMDQDGQKFDFLESIARPGFYLVKNNNGKCISVPDKTNRQWARLHASRCNASEAGQNWKWNYMH